MPKWWLWCALGVVVGLLLWYYLVKKPLSGAAAAVKICDQARLTCSQVGKIARPNNLEALRNVILHAQTMGLTVSVAGARYSQGGQICPPSRPENGDHAIVVDMSNFNQIVSLNAEKREITVESGATWRQVQEAIDPHGLSVSVMQSYCDFSVGGSLSVNCHGRGVHKGPIISTVKSISILLADASVVETRAGEELFRAAIGGYGGLGIILSATLHLDENYAIERQATLVNVSEYPQFFETHIRHNPNAVFHNGNLYPNQLQKVLAVTWFKTNKFPTTTCASVARPDKKVYPKQMAIQHVYTRLPVMKQVRELIEPMALEKPAIVSRNHEMSYSVKEHDSVLTNGLGEYFIPLEKLNEFIDVLRQIISDHGVNMLNVSLRFVPQDDQCILSYSPNADSFAVVLYFNMDNSPTGKNTVRQWTRKLIDGALALGGTYYLPYLQCATPEQMSRAYPSLTQFFKIKQHYDPTGVFSNALLQTMRKSQQ